MSSLDGVFFAAGQALRPDLQGTADCRFISRTCAYSKFTIADGKPLALFIGDYYARPSKRGGAWMNAYVPQSDLFGTKPVVANHLNIPKPPRRRTNLAHLR